MSLYLYIQKVFWNIPEAYIGTILVVLTNKYSQHDSAVWKFLEEISHKHLSKRWLNPTVTCFTIRYMSQLSLQVNFGQVLEYS